MAAPWLLIDRWRSWSLLDSSTSWSLRRKNGDDQARCPTEYGFFPFFCRCTTLTGVEEAESTSKVWRWMVDDTVHGVGPMFEISTSCCSISPSPELFRTLIAHIFFFFLILFFHSHYTAKSHLGMATVRAACGDWRAMHRRLHLFAGGCLYHAENQATAHAPTVQGEAGECVDQWLCRITLPVLFEMNSSLYFFFWSTA